MNAISLRSTDTKCYARSPYLPSFVRGARNLNGKWSDPEWVFDIRDLERVRALLLECYGTDGTPTPTCSIRVNLDSWCYSDAFYVAGRLVAQRRGRDDRVKLGDGVVILSGGFPKSGGSVKNPRLAADPGTVVEIRDVPLGIAKRFAAYAPTYEGDPITIVEGSIVGDETQEDDSRSRAIAQIRALMEAHSITIGDLEGQEVPC